MDESDVDNVLKFPGRRYVQVWRHDRPDDKKVWLRMRRLGRLWSRFKHEPGDDRVPPWEVFDYWAWSGRLESVEERLPFAERVAKYKAEKRYEQEYPDLPF